MALNHKYRPHVLHGSFSCNLSFMLFAAMLSPPSVVFARKVLSRSVSEWLDARGDYSVAAGEDLSGGGDERWLPRFKAPDIEEILPRLKLSPLAVVPSGEGVSYLCR